MKVAFLRKYNQFINNTNQKEENNYIELHNLKNVLWTDTIKSMNEQAKEWEIIFATSITNKGLKSKMYKEIPQISNKKKTNKKYEKYGQE